MKKILLIEDDPFLIDIYRTKFQEEGFSVSIVKDGKDVLNKIKEDIPDVIILDIVLPGSDGFDILRDLKSEENLKKIKVVILSNLGRKSEIERGLSLGADKYLIKAHYTPGDVVKEVKQLFE
jgi:DNA-binding response OmpR family regulator